MRLDRLAFALGSAATLAIATSAAAQNSDANDWLDQCRNRNWHGWSDRARYCEMRTMGFHARGGTIAVDGRENGGVRVRGWDHDSVAITAEVQTEAESQDDARALAGRISIDASGETIHADGPSPERHQSWSVSYMIYVPQHSDLRIETNNGPIAVDQVSGHMDLEAENGPLVLDEDAGDVHGRTTNGPLRVTLAGTKWNGAGLDAETTNGPVVLHIPDQYSAHLETGTVNGPMAIGFPITVQGHLGRHISTDLGSGGATIRVLTTNGPVVIDRR